PMGQEGGAGNLVICEVVMMHIADEILDDNQQIDPFKIDLVARMGGNWYTRAAGDALFEIPKPIRNKGIGVDQLPESVRNSTVLTGNNLGRLGNIASLPEDEAIAEHEETQAVQDALKTDQPVTSLHLLARQQLDQDAEKALKTLLIANELTQK
ncbi:MAG: flavin reductase family protein, partial [Cyclobacteriaceae bacterium]